MRQKLMYVVFAFLMILFYSIVINNGANGDWLVTGLSPIVISLLCMRLLRWLLEENEPEGMFNRATQSWAFMFGDALMLPGAMITLTLGVDELDFSGSRWFEANWWLYAALFIGIGLGVGFHFMDASAYKAQDCEDALYCPTKVWHDFVVYPALGASLVFLGIPVLVNAFLFHGLVALVFISGWLGLGIYDGKRGLHPFMLHPAWDKIRFRVKRFKVVAGN